MKNNFKFIDGLFTGLVNFTIGVLIFISSFDNSFAKEYKLTKSVDLFQYLLSDKSREKRPEIFEKIGFFPDMKILGWSKTGKVAWYEEGDTGGKGGDLITFYIADLVTDNIVWLKEYDGDEFPVYSVGENRVESDTTEKFEEYIFRIKYKEIAKAFLENKIEQITIPYQKFPIKYNNETFNCKIKIKKENKADEFWDKVKNYKIVVNYNNKEKTVTENNNPTAINVNLCGYFLSPFEPRVFIVYAEEHWGFEESVLEYSFTGCSLLKGFR